MKEKAVVETKWKRPKMEAKDDNRNDEDVTKKHRSEEETPVPDKGPSAMVRVQGEE